MARYGIVLAIAALLAASVLAQPTIHEITNGQTPKLSLKHTTGLAKLSTRDSTQLYYGHINVPQGAYAIVANASIINGITAGTCTDYISTPITGTIDMDVVVSSIMPCSYTFAAEFAGTATEPLTICYSEGYSGYTQQHIYDYLGYSSTYSTVGFSVVNDAYYQWDDNTSPAYTLGTSNMAIYPNSDLWLAVGRYDEFEYYMGCDFTIQATVFSCPANTLPVSSSGASAVGSPGNAICASYQNLTISASAPAVNATAYAGGGTGTVNQGFNISVIPPGTSYLWINITYDYSGSSPVFYGASFLPSLAATSYSQYECYGDYSWSIYSATFACGTATCQTLSTPCFSPQWNGTYYVAAIFDATIMNMVAVEAVICPSGFTGTQCLDPLVPVDLHGTSTQSISLATGPNGYGHVYFDWPAWTWNTSVIIATADSGASLFLRANTYSQYYSTYACTEGETYCTYSYNSPSDSGVRAAGSTGIASTPMDRYRGQQTRWVFTYSCATSSGSCGTKSVSFNFTTSALTPANGSNASFLAPLSVALLFALLAVFLF